MDGIVEFILISVTLAAAVLGTVSSPSRKAKAALIGLAVVTSLATGYKAYDTARESRINKKLVIALVQASNPPQYFSHDLVEQLSPLLDEHDQYVAGQTVFEDSGERIFTLKNEGSMLDSVTGVIYISKRNMNPIYYAYAIDGDVKRELNKVLKESWSSCNNHWNRCIQELAAISKIALEVAPIEVRETVSEMDSESLSFQLTSDQTFNGAPISIKFDRKFIESLYGLPASRRGIRILEEGQTYVISNL